MLPLLWLDKTLRHRNCQVRQDHWTRWDEVNEKWGVQIICYTIVLQKHQLSIITFSKKFNHWIKNRVICASVSNAKVESSTAYTVRSRTFHIILTPLNIKVLHNLTLFVRFPLVLTSKNKYSTGRLLIHQFTFCHSFWSWKLHMHIIFN